MTSRILTVLVASAFTTSAAAAPTVLAIAPVGTKADTEVLAPEGSAGQVVAGRLSASGSPFSVRSVSYELIGLDGECDAGLSHSVRVWKGRTLRPAASPASAQTYTMPAQMDVASRMITVNLDTSIRLEIGESLFVAVEMKQDGDMGMCVAAVTGAPKDTLRQFVSPTVSAPYAWSSFESFGADVSLTIQASGSPVR